MMRPGNVTSSYETQLEASTNDSSEYTTSRTSKKGSWNRNSLVLKMPGIWSAG